MDYTSIITIAIVVVAFIILFKVFKLISRLLLVAVFLLIAWYTNPTEDKHKAAVRDKATLGGLSLIGKSTVAENYYVFSLTYVKSLSDKKVVGVGAFTQVFIFRNP